MEKLLASLDSECFQILKSSLIINEFTKLSMIHFSYTVRASWLFWRSLQQRKHRAFASRWSTIGTSSMKSMIDGLVVSSLTSPHSIQFTNFFPFMLHKKEAIFLAQNTWKIGRVHMFGFSSQKYWLNPKSCKIVYDQESSFGI